MKTDCGINYIEIQKDERKPGRYYHNLHKVANIHITTLE